jgi:hypothetical protein
MTTHKTFLPLALALPLGALCISACGNSLNNNNGDQTVCTTDCTPVNVPGCMGDCQVRNDCPTDQGPTTITGTVTIPAGGLPVNNARVYIPKGALPPTPMTGVNCETCSAFPDSVAGVTTLPDGKFTITGVPGGQKIPLVINVGK